MCFSRAMTAYTASFLIQSSFRWSHVRKPSYAVLHIGEERHKLRSGFPPLCTTLNRHADDNSHPYGNAHEDIKGTLAYCGFRCYRDAFRYILSPCFLPCLLTFWTVWADRMNKTKPAFKTLMTLIDMHNDTNINFIFPKRFAGSQKELRRSHQRS